MQIAICDDDEAMRRVYRGQVMQVGRELDMAFQVRMYANGKQLLFSMEEAEPDVILLDVNMPEMNGVETGKCLRERGYTGAIIYVTATSDYVFDAFDVGAFNYVLKADGRGMERFNRVFTEAVQAMRARNKKFILINGISEHRNLPIDTLRYFESVKHVCVVHYGLDERFEFISSLSKIGNALAAYGFVRIHRSYLVNSAFVERYTFKKCMLTNGVELPVGRQKYAAFKKVMEARSRVQTGREDGSATDA